MRTKICGSRGAGAAFLKLRKSMAVERTVTVLIQKKYDLFYLK
jgi:hypothetical protein